MCEINNNGPVQGTSPGFIICIIKMRPDKVISPRVSCTLPEFRRSNFHHFLVCILFYVLIICILFYCNLT